MKAIALVAGGNVSREFLTVIQRADYIIGVDRGALWLITHAIIPDVAIGDFDSVTKKEKTIILKKAKRVQTYNAEKDATDLELAIEEAIQLKPKIVHLFGVLGKRFDHEMGAIGMVRRLVSHNIYGQIVDKYNKINIVRRGRQKFSRDDTLRYLSVVALEQGSRVTLRGVRYPVTKFIFSTSSSRGISNEITANVATVTVHSGLVLCIQSSDTPVR